ncbi:MAG: hypothetical protein F6K14_31585 [Symploca sp. SIO2C1]|nr:hypothetical protein [Symploca sp. SIO2C1]
MYKIINLFLILILAFFCLDVQAALAHAPHDVISQIAISPTYTQTLIAGTQKGLFKTEDGGESWVELAGKAYGGSGYIEAIAISPNYKSDKTFMITVIGLWTKNLYSSFSILHSPFSIPLTTTILP